MTQDDALFKLRVRLLSLAQEIGVRAACRAMDVHHSTYYRWKRQADRFGLEILRPRERRQPRMANATPQHIEQRAIAFALGHPGFGPERISAELRRDKWGGIRISPNGVWRVLRRHGLNTRAKRLGLVAGYAAPPEPSRPRPKDEKRHLDVERPGQLVQMDCFCVGGHEQNAVVIAEDKVIPTHAPVSHRGGFQRVSRTGIEALRTRRDRTEAEDREPDRS